MQHCGNVKLSSFSIPSAAGKMGKRDIFGVIFSYFSKQNMLTGRDDSNEESQKSFP